MPFCQKYWTFFCLIWRYRFLCMPVYTHTHTHIYIYIAAYLHRHQCKWPLTKKVPHHKKDSFFPWCLFQNGRHKMNLERFCHMRFLASRELIFPPKKALLSLWFTQVYFFMWVDSLKRMWPKLRLDTLQGTNISPKNGILKMIFPFPRWDMLIPWRVLVVFSMKGVFFPAKLTFDPGLPWPAKTHRNDPGVSVAHWNRKRFGELSRKSWEGGRNADF